MSKPTFAIQLTLSFEQADAAAKALNLYARILCGQFDDIYNAFWAARLPDGMSREASAHFQAVLEVARFIAFPKYPDKNGGPGIGHHDVPQVAKICWDIHQAIRELTFTHDWGAKPSLHRTSKEGIPKTKKLEILDQLADVDDEDDF